MPAMTKQSAEGELLLLAADIGGTNGRFMLFTAKKDPSGFILTPIPESRLSLKTPEYANFSAFLDALRDHYASLPTLQSRTKKLHLDAACLAVPGAPQNGFCHAPNIRWPLSEAEASSQLNVRTLFINDFTAQGQACLYPQLLGLRSLLPGRTKTGSPAVVLGAGTGLGKSIILPEADPRAPLAQPEQLPWQERQEALPQSALVPFADSDKLADVCSGSPAEGRSGNLTGGRSGGNSGPAPALPVFGKGARVLPSEGGHALFPFAGEKEFQFAAFVRAKTGREQVIGDMVVTGAGLAALYAFHSGAEHFLPPPQVTPLLDNVPAALEWLARFYGRVCRNLVLETLALGGVFLSGGLLAHVPGLLEHPAFVREFRQCETQRALLAEVPVWWVSNQDAGLWGAALCAAQSLR